MNKDRLLQILKEKETTPEAYQRDGYKYFDEAIPALSDYIVLRDIAARNDEALEKKIAFTPVHQERIEGAAVTKEVNRRIKNLRKTDLKTHVTARKKTKR